MVLQQWTANEIIRGECVWCKSSTFSNEDDLVQSSPVWCPNTILYFLSIRTWLGSLHFLGRLIGFVILYCIAYGSSIAFLYRGRSKGATEPCPKHYRDVFQRTLFNEFSELFWNSFIIHLSKTCNQSHSSIYAACVDLPICLFVCCLSVFCITSYFFNLINLGDQLRWAICFSGTRHCTLHCVVSIHFYAVAQLAK